MSYPKVLKDLNSKERAKDVFLMDVKEYQMTNAESAHVLNRFVGRNLLTSEAVNFLSKMGCNFHVPLKNGLKVGHNLSGRLTPRLICTLEEKGYHFKDEVDTQGRSVAFYLGCAGSEYYMPETISALKAVGIDFNKPDKNGRSALDYMADEVARRPVRASRLLGEEKMHAVLAARGVALLRQAVVDAVNALPVRITEQGVELLVSSYTGRNQRGGHARS